MFSFRKWVERIARETADATAKAEREAYANEIDSELDDGIILLYAREKRLLPAKEWREKALAWQKEFKTERIDSTPYVDGCGGVWYSTGRSAKLTPIASAMRRASLEANVEIAEAEQKAATDALRAAKKAVPRG